MKPSAKEILVAVVSLACVLGVWSALFGALVFPGPCAQSARLSGTAGLSSTIDGKAALVDPGSITRQNSTGSSPSDGGVFSMSWRHDPDGAGPLCSVLIEVRYEQQPGEDSATACRKFKQRCEQALATFPPNVGP